MALNIKNPEVERLATEVARLTGSTKTEAIRVALTEHRDRLSPPPASNMRLENAMRFLEEKVWPNLPPEVRGKRITKAEREDILGIGPDGYCVGPDGS